MTQAVLAEDEAIDPNCDPRKLALLGARVRQHLAQFPQVRRVEVQGADLYVAPGFLKKADCKEIVRVINSNATPSTLYRGAEREGFRTSYTHHFDCGDPLVSDLESYISEVLGIELTYAEKMQGQRYQVGQEFKHHHDFFHLGAGYWQHEAERGGQRSWTAMIFLNEPREGGETDFPHLRRTFRPSTGTMVIWNNMDAGGRPNMKTLHAGMPVKRGIKHVITMWFRQEPWRLFNPA